MKNPFNKHDYQFLLQTILILVVWAIIGYVVLGVINQ
jgi:hypothetical protein